MLCIRNLLSIPHIPFDESLIGLSTKIYVYFPPFDLVLE